MCACIYIRLCVCMFILRIIYFVYFPSCSGVDTSPGAGSQSADPKRAVQLGRVAEDTVRFPLIFLFLTKNQRVRLSLQLMRI